MNETERALILKYVHTEAILSGSMSLKLQGFLPKERQINDLDLVFTSKDKLDKYLLNNNYQARSLSPEEYQDNCYRLIDTNIKIDCFINLDCIFESYPLTVPGITCNLDELTTILVQNPLQILQAKLQILYDRALLGRLDRQLKHLRDINYIFDTRNYK